MELQIEYDEITNITYIINCIDLLEKNDMDFNETCSKIGNHFGCEYRGIPKNDMILIDKILSVEDIKVSLIFKSPKTIYQRERNTKVIASDIKLEYPQIRNDEDTFDVVMTRIINSEELADNLGITVEKLGEILCLEHKCIVDMELIDPKMMFQGKYSSKQIKKAIKLGGKPTKDTFIPQLTYRESINSTILFNYELLCSILAINIDELIIKINEKLSIISILIDDNTNLSIPGKLSLKDVIKLIKSI
jgi:hypothetical protein